MVEAVRANPSKTVEFVYLTYRDPSSYNPYNLKIVPYESDSKDFFTMSAAGVTHFVNGVAGILPVIVTGLPYFFRVHPIESMGTRI